MAKTSKHEQAKQEVRAQLTAFFGRYKINKNTINEMCDRLLDRKAVPTFADSPDLLVIRHTFAAQRAMTRKASK